MGEGGDRSLVHSIKFSKENLQIFVGLCTICVCMCSGEDGVRTKRWCVEGGGQTVEKRTHLSHWCTHAERVPS